MVGNKKNREKLAAALVAHGLREVSTNTDGIYFGAGYGDIVKKQAVIYLQNGRGAPTLVEYNVSWYSESLTGKADEMAARVATIVGLGHVDELRELRGLFKTLDEHIDGSRPNQAYIKSLSDEIGALTSKLRNTPAWIKANQMLDYFHRIHALDFEPVDHFTKTNNIVKGLLGATK